MELVTPKSCAGPTIKLDLARSSHEIWDDEA